jgi:copper homeostasis protein
MDEGNLLVEAVGCSVEDCLEAHAGGADRVELCSAMVLGGLTPTAGTLIEVRQRVRMPVMVMIRPRPGGFAYSAAEFAVMRRDAEWALRHGAAGIVFGILHPSGQLDVERCGELVAMAREAGREAVFHRAFDVVPEPLAALDALMELGVSRILTSGQQPTALAGAPLIAELVRRAGSRLQVLAGGGVRDTNVAELLRTTGVRQVHLGPFVSRSDVSGQGNPALDFGSYPVTDAAALRRLRAAAAAVSPGA